ncbi:MAG TPA: type II toxin-antitoxin system RelE/ParE family toxin [Rhabdochlamydiaceae bacterium]|nr:type II toxin-antitoxin system RelE/ParE family toxin [Rhabdochlamydiaceae bacterium]
MSKFSAVLDSLIDAGKISERDYEDFEKSLLDNVEQGSLIQETGGIRKTRLKSATKGKRGGFRVCYFDNPNKENLFLIVIYGKNEKEDLSSGEKKILKSLVQRLKR